MIKEIGIIGLGKMGGGLALNLIEHDWDVYVYNRTRERTNEIVKESDVQIKPAYSYEELVKSFSGNGPAYIWLMLPAGEVVDDVIDELAPLLAKNDMIIDGGNGFFRDAIRRAKHLRTKDIRFIDVGVSGGPHGARHGACMMVGGAHENFAEVEELFKDLCVKAGYEHFIGDGAGHFVKMVHNGIEYGMMEALAEGFALLHTCGETLKECTYNFDLEKVARVYNHGSVIESRLVGWLEKSFKEWGPDLDLVSGRANQTGEGRWTSEVADEMGVRVDTINDAIEAREYSQKVPNFGGKLIQAMRGQFGGHPVLKSQEPTKSGKRLDQDATEDTGGSDE